MRTGVDVVSLKRFRRATRSRQLLNRVFTDDELECSKEKRDPQAHLACLFAAKEACLKALGATLISGIRWKDMEVVSVPEGGPELVLRGIARDLLRERKVHLSMTCGVDLAAALVMVE